MIAAVFWFITRRQKLGLLDRKLEREGWLFISPWLIGFVALTLGPIVLSLLLSFTRWTGMNPMSYAQFVGLDNFKQLLMFDDDLVPSLRVTAYYALLMVPIGQTAALAVAMLMNARVRSIGLFRSIYYLPTLVGGVTMATMWLWLYDPQLRSGQSHPGPDGALVRDDAARLGRQRCDCAGASRHSSSWGFGRSAGGC